MKTALSAVDLSIGYRRGRDDQVVAEHLDVSLHRGELVCLIGANGVGKSTLMRTLAGMQPALGGTLCLGDRRAADLTALELAATISVVLTERIDVGLLTAREVIALGRHPYTDWLGRLQAHDQAMIDQAIQAVGAGELAHRRFDQLSDGERQKVLIARALAQETPIMLLDEPTAFLDVPRRADVLYMLRDLAHDTGRAILLSTHDLELALRTADRLWLFGAAGQLTTGAPEDVVLSGAFETAFADPYTHFNIASGSFIMIRAPRGLIRVTGDGVRAEWTRRALERAGWQVKDYADDHITVNAVDWHGMIGGRRGAWTTLGEIVEALHENSPNA
jgi:iron complex transport system ATP-binding protein